jgi:hypothetical protein
MDTDNIIANRNRVRQYWDIEAKRLYQRDASAFALSHKGKRWTSYEKLGEREKDYWRARSQQRIQELEEVEIPAAMAAEDEAAMAAEDEAA